jgi:chaperonin GroEL
LGDRRALLIATDHYEDQTFGPLSSPSLDIDALAEVLGDPELGDFSVVKLVNRPHDEITREIEKLLGAARHDDQILVYFSCHGFRDLGGRLHFVAQNSEESLIDSSFISAYFVNRQFARSVAGSKVLILDCCFSGSFRFDFGVALRAVWRRVPLTEMTGNGYVVFTATDEFEFARDGTGKKQTPSEISPYSRAIVDGITTGEADVNGDGIVSVADLDAYLRSKRFDGQTPKFFALDADGQIILSRVRPAVPEPEIELDPPEFQEPTAKTARTPPVVTVPEPGQRIGWSARLQAHYLEPWGTSLAIFLGLAAFAGGRFTDLPSLGCVAIAVATFVVVYGVRVVLSAAFHPPNAKVVEAAEQSGVRTFEGIR